MTVSELKKSIMYGKLNNFYIFSGDEITIQNIYINKISEVVNKPVSRVDTVASIFKTLGSLSLFQKSYCYVVRDDKIFMNDPKAVKSVCDRLKDDILVLLVSNLDKRSKFYKENLDTIVEFNYLEPKWLTKYINQNIVLSSSNCNYLSQFCENDYGRVLLEVDKLKHYKSSVYPEDTTYDRCFEIMVNEGVIHKAPTDAIFELVDAILNRDYRLAFDLYDECIEYGENPLTIINVLFTNTKQLLQVQACKSSNIEHTTGLSYVQIKSAQKKLNRYSTTELVDMLYLIRFVEKSIKTGTIDTYVAVPYILVNV